jgi:hypothetical protein
MRFGLAHQMADFSACGPAGGGAVAVGAAVGIAPRRAPAARGSELNVDFGVGGGQGTGLLCRYGDVARDGLAQGRKFARDAANGAGKARGGQMHGAKGDIRAE